MNEDAFSEALGNAIARKREAIEEAESLLMEIRIHALPDDVQKMVVFLQDYIAAYEEVERLKRVGVQAGGN